jgi:hypothetical protein
MQEDFCFIEAALLRCTNFRRAGTLRFLKIGYGCAKLITEAAGWIREYRGVRPPIGPNRVSSPAPKPRNRPTRRD